MKTKEKESKVISKANKPSKVTKDKLPKQTETPVSSTIELVEYDDLPIYLQIVIGKNKLDNLPDKNIIRVYGKDSTGAPVSELVYAANVIEAVMSLVNDFADVSHFEQLELVDTSTGVDHHAEKLDFVISNLDARDLDQDFSVLQGELDSDSSWVGDLPEEKVGTQEPLT